MITRRLGETDADLRAQQHAYKAKSKLKNLLRKLGLKSARGLSINFAGMQIFKPGVY